MSVIVSKRGPQKFGVITKAIKLAVYTVKICANNKYFPKKYRWMLTNRIVTEALNIVLNLRKANNLNLNRPELHADRYSHQMEANGACEALLTLIEVAWGVMPLSENRIEYWTGMVIDVEESLKTWVDSDRKRIAGMKPKLVKTSNKVA